MKAIIWFLAALLAAQPAAAWEINSSDTKKSWMYSAYQADKSGSIELQFYCDDAYPGEIQLLVFTNLDADETDDDFPTVTVSAKIDGTTFDDLTGYYDNVDGERTVVVDTLEEDRVYDIVDVVRQAREPIQISYDGYTHRFGVDDVETVLGTFSDGCER